MREAHAFSIHALSLIVAIVWTRQLAAVLASVPLIAHAFPINTPAIVVTLVRAGRDGAIGAFPSRVTDTAAGFLLVRTMATAARVHT